tara:strand:- start:659 stop:1387 length:729 start_codon:yes stop_codon:yes gene_type:complete
MNETNTNKIVINRPVEIVQRGKDGSIQEIHEVKKTSQDAIQITLLVGKTKSDVEAFTFDMKVDQLRFLNEYVADELNLSTEQLKAIHAKKSEMESASKESVKPTVTTPSRSSSVSTKPPIKVVLPSQAEPPVDWKNNEDVKRYKRPHLTDEVVNQLLEMVFRYTPGHRKNLTYSRYLFDKLPEQFGISQDQAERIYLCKSYAHIGRQYKSSWTKKLNELCRVKGMNRQIPDKIRKMYLRGGN